MSAHAYMTGISKSGATPPVFIPCGWDEPFDQASWSAFAGQYASYAGYDTQMGYVRADELPIGGPPTPTVSGGLLEVSSAVDVNEFAFGPPQATVPTAQFWYKCDYVYTGGDPTTGFFVLFGWNGYEWPNNDIGSPETGLVVAAALGRIRLFWWPLDGSSGSNSLAFNPTYYTGGNPSLPTHATLGGGDHSMIVCLSEDGPGTTATLELWNDAAPGSAAAMSVTLAKDAHEGINAWSVDVRGRAAGFGTTLQLKRMQIVCGTRASDPFGIL